MGSYLANELSVLQSLIEQLSKILQTLPQSGDNKKPETSAGKISDDGLSKFKASPSESTPGSVIRILTSGVVMTVFLLKHATFFVLVLFLLPAYAALIGFLSGGLG